MSSLRWQMQVFQNANLCSRAQVFIIASIFFYFLATIASRLSFSRICLPNIQIWIIIVCLLGNLSKLLLLGTTVIRWYEAEVLDMYFSFHYMGIKKHGDLRKLMFIASSGAFVTKRGFFSFCYYMDFKVKFCDIPSVSALCACHSKIKIILSPSIWPLDP